MTWSGIRSFGRRLFGRERVERDLDDEVQSYVALLADEKAAAGLPPEEARRRAAAETGVEQVKEEVRHARVGRWIEDAAQDVRFGARLLARTPGFTLAAVVALALGIGAATVIYGAVDAVLLRPLPYTEPDRLVVVLHGGRHPVAAGSYAELRQQATAFEALGAAEYWRPNLGADDGPETVTGVRLTAEVLRLTGVKPALGRLFAEDEEEPGREKVLVLGHGLWQRRFAGDPGVVGRSVRLDGTPYTVVGIMPRASSSRRPSGPAGRRCGRRSRCATGWPPAAAGAFDCSRASPPGLRWSGPSRRWRRSSIAWRRTTRAP
jgi:putative ABC transport system permease protein